jgi:phosphohistidine phosphatase
MRHAKSDWYSDAETDFKRPLNERGERDAPRMGKEIRNRDLVPDHILSSRAKRAAETAKAVADQSGFTGIIEWVDDFYFGSMGEILAHIKKLDNSFKRVLIVGHNPTWEQLAERLVKGNIEINMSTASLVSVDAVIENWSDLELGKCHFNWLLNPKMLND